MALGALVAIACSESLFGGTRHLPCTINVSLCALMLLPQEERQKNKELDKGPSHRSSVPLYAVSYLCLLGQQLLACHPCAVKTNLMVSMSFSLPRPAKGTQKTYSNSEIRTSKHGGIFVRSCWLGRGSVPYPQSISAQIGNVDN